MSKLIENPNARQRVLLKLIEAKTKRMAYFAHRERIPVGWVPLHILCQPGVGGLAGDVRLRELRRDPHNLPILWQYFKTSDGKSTNTTIYFLMCDPDEIDIETCSLTADLQEAI